MHPKTNLLEGGPSRRRSRSTGFTLIELMITVGIVAILTAIAYPSYRNYVIRGQFADATNGLAAMRANMERYFQDNRTYAAVGIFIPPCQAVPTPTSGKFTITCTGAGVPTATTYQLQAQGTTAGSALYGFVFTVDQDGNQATVVTSPPAPSAFLSCPTAWITKTGGC
jgi:type IV pilus assembly protein PilE